ncbi:MAG: hypothetical protein GAK29_04944 [Acinetobacter bereziniae]|uniref:Uncharacterized protein n=1 Tax=Acinetobacter bereziniae TaxID=106648 RepID=A0A833UM65_ACIBZ|nr:MAG: hypothetical protein GAK29_04944 [Acinetobacter bereziniae]
MTYYQIMLNLYNKDDPKVQCNIWANYDKNGFFIKLTNLYGEELPNIINNEIYVKNNTWVLKDHFFKLYHHYNYLKKDYYS